MTPKLVVYARADAADPDIVDALGARLDSALVIETEPRCLMPELQPGHENIIFFWLVPQHMLLQLRFSTHSPSCLRDGLNLMRFAGHTYDVNFAMLSTADVLAARTGMATLSTQCPQRIASSTSYSVACCLTTTPTR
jgi:hypothetical protein